MAVPTEDVSEDYYDLLGVPPTATDKELSRAYRRLARQLHPDTGADRASGERFKAVAAAYAVLSDPERRRAYDSGGHGALGNWLEGDLFGAVLSTQRRRTRPVPTRGEDLHSTLTLDPAAAAGGTTAKVSARQRVACADCSSTGVRAGERPARCRGCAGEGAVVAGLGALTVTSVCGRCGGSGLALELCPACDGTGDTEVRRTATVRVPPGVQEGQRLRVVGLGAPGSNGGEPGDLLLAVQVQAREATVAERAAG